MYFVQCCHQCIIECPSVESGLHLIFYLRCIILPTSTILPLTINATLQYYVFSPKFYFPPDDFEIGVLALQAQVPSPTRPRRQAETPVSLHLDGSMGMRPDLINPIVPKSEKHTNTQYGRNKVIQIELYRNALSMCDLFVVWGGL